MKNQIVLRNAMTAKTAFFGISCIFICLFSSTFSELFGAGSSNIIFGMGLVLFNLAAFTAITLLRGKIENAASKALIVADIVIVCVLFGSLATQTLPFNSNGYVITGMIASMIAGLAYAQHFGLKYELERTMPRLHELEIVKSDVA